MIRFLFFFFFQFIFLSTNGQFRVVKNVDKVVMMDGGIEVLSYNTKSSRQTEYNRVGYIHPLNNLNGEILTEDFPVDHPYHNGIFWAWHQVMYDGQRVANAWTCDNIVWNIKKNRVRVDNNKMTLLSTVDWEVGLHVAEKPTALLRESLAITVYPKQIGYRVVDVNLNLKRKVSKEVFLGGADDEKGYGGFCLRLGYYDNIIFNTANGVVKAKEVAVTAGDWVDFVKGGGQNEGVAVFVGSNGDDYKGKWILRDYGSMQNPVFPGRDPVVVPREGINLRYRIIVYGKDFERKKLPILYEDYKKVIKK